MSAIEATLAAGIRREHELAQQSFRATVEHAVRCGELLTQAKASVPHGQWLPWLAENFPASEWTAQAYMRLARNAGRVTDLEAAPSIRAALAELAQPRADDEAVLRRIQHEAAEEDLRDHLATWREDCPDWDAEIAWGVTLVTLWGLIDSGAPRDFGFASADGWDYVDARLPDVRATLDALECEMQEGQR